MFLRYLHRRTFVLICLLTNIPKKAPHFLRDSLIKNICPRGRTESEHQVPTLGLRIFSPPLYQLSYVPKHGPEGHCHYLLRRCAHSQISPDTRQSLRQRNSKLLPTPTREPSREISYRAMTPGSRHTYCKEVIARFIHQSQLNNTTLFCCFCCVF